MTGLQAVDQRLRNSIIGRGPAGASINSPPTKSCSWCRRVPASAETRVCRPGLADARAARNEAQRDARSLPGIRACSHVTRAVSMGNRCSSMGLMPRGATHVGPGYTLAGGGRGQRRHARRALAAGAHSSLPANPADRRDRTGARRRFGRLHGAADRGRVGGQPVRDPAGRPRARGMQAVSQPRGTTRGRGSDHRLRALPRLVELRGSGGGDRARHNPGGERPSGSLYEIVGGDHETDEAAFVDFARATCGLVACSS